MVKWRVCSSGAVGFRWTEARRLRNPRLEGGEEGGLGWGCGLGWGGGHGEGCVWVGVVDVWCLPKVLVELISHDKLTYLTYLT